MSGNFGVMVVFGMLIVVQVLLMMLAVGFNRIQNLLAVWIDEVCPGLPKRSNNEVDEANLMRKTRNITILVWLSMM